MFEFLRRRPKDPDDPLLTPKTALAFVRDLPASDLLGKCQKATRALADLERTSEPIDTERASAIESLDLALAADRRELTRQYIDNADPTGPIATRLWTTAYDASQAYIVVYRRAADQALLYADAASWKPFLPRLCARLMYFYGLDAKLRVLRNERWIPAKWLEVHDLYRRAAAKSVERTIVATASAGSKSPQTVEQEYLAMLLTQLLNTGSLTGREVNWAVAQIRSWCRTLQLDATPPATGGGFCVDLDGRAGFVRRAESDTGPTLRFFDTAPLAAEIVRAIVATRRSKGDDHDHRVRPRQRVLALEKIAPALAPDQQSALAREPRIPIGRAAAVRIGLARICQERELQHDGDSAFDPVARGGSLATPEAHPQGESRQAYGDAPVARATESDSRWRVEDRSLGGMRVRALGNVGQAAALGTLVAVREEDASNWAVGIVRRLNRANTEVDIGISTIAHKLAVVTLNVKRQAREDMSIVVDGIDVSTLGERIDGLYLPPPSRPGKPILAKSLVIPTKEFADGRHLLLITGPAVYTVALKGVVEQRLEWTWVTIDIVDETARH